MDKQAQIDSMRQINLLETKLDGLIRPEVGVQPIAAALMSETPGLRGLWPMSSFDENGNAFDLSGQGRTLSYNGSPTYNYDGLAPYIDLNHATNDYLSRADEGGLDILGTEAYVANPGLIFGGWFRFDRLGVSEHLIGKLGVVGQFSYRIVKGATNVLTVQISVDGTATHQASSAAVTTGIWYHIMALFVPSTKTSIILNGVEASNAVAVPASIFNSTAAFTIGNDNGGFSQYLNGQVSNCLLCASADSLSAIRNLYQQQRGMYGV